MLHLANTKRPKKDQKVITTKNRVKIIEHYNSVLKQY